MVICYFNAIGVSVFPAKAYSPPIIYPDAKLSLAIALQGFEPIAWWNSEVFQMPGPMKVQKLSSRDPLN